MNKAAILGVAAIGVLAVVAFAGDSNAQPSPTPSTIAIAGQGYFNSLPPGQQQAVLAALWRWYRSGQWPATVGDPGLSNPTDLTDPGNFGIVVDAYQYGRAQPGAIAGVLDAKLAASLQQRT